MKGPVDERVSRAEVVAGVGVTRRRLVGPDDRAALQRAAADNVKRVFVPRGTPRWEDDPGTARLAAFVETKTVWHPIGV